MIETERLVIREMDAERDAGFIFSLLNSPKFIQYIGDRGVRSKAAAAIFIKERYQQSYRDHGYGLYTVELLSTSTPVGVCGFVRRETLAGPDLGFAFLPEFERKGYGIEAAAEMLNYGRETLGFDEVLAITSLDNDASVGLLEKLGFAFQREIESGDETLKLFSINLR